MRKWFKITFKIDKWSKLFNAWKSIDHISNINIWCIAIVTVDADDRTGLYGRPHKHRSLEKSWHLPNGYVNKCILCFVDIVEIQCYCIRASLISIGKSIYYYAQLINAIHQGKCKCIRLLMEQDVKPLRAYC